MLTSLQCKLSSRSGALGSRHAPRHQCPVKTPPFGHVKTRHLPASQLSGPVTLIFILLLSYRGGYIGILMRCGNAVQVGAAYKLSSKQCLQSKTRLE